MKPFSPMPEQSDADQLIQAQLRALSDLLARPHSLEELQTEVNALGEIVQSVRSPKAKASDDGQAVAEQRRQGKRRALKGQNKNHTLSFNMSQEMIRKSGGFATKDRRPAPPDAHFDFSQNLIIGRLLAEEGESMRAYLERVPLSLGEVLYRDGQPAQYLYFPETAVLSLVSMMEDGSTVGVGLVGSEGMVGLRALSTTAPPYYPVVQRPGTALRMKTEALRGDVQARSVLQKLLLDYTQAALTQTRQLAACNQLHTIEQKLVRWLLMLHDRAGSNSFLLTQDLIASLIGARRSGVSVAASLLQEAGIIQYRRGLITVLNRKSLEAAACECYASLREFPTL